MGPTFVSCVVEVCRLGLEPPCHSSYPLTGISSGVTKFENHWKVGPNYRLDDDWTPPSRTPAVDVLTVESCVVIDLTQLKINFHRRYALYIQNLYHRPHFTVGGSWNKSPQLQPLQRCYCENSGNITSACVMRRQYFITYTQSLSTYFVDSCRFKNILELLEPNSRYGTGTQWWKLCTYLN